MAVPVIKLANLSSMFTPPFKLVAGQGGQSATCCGDCNGDGQVTVDEILTMVNIALGDTPVTTCEPGDANHDGQITVDEILAAVNQALNGCSVP